MRKISLLLFFLSSVAYSAPVLKVEAPRLVKKGDAFAITYSVTNLPSGASIGFYLERENSAAQGLPGPTGAMAIKSSPAQSTGSFLWDGKSFGCAPTDAPTVCATPIEPGRYRIRAKLFDKPDAFLIGLMRQAMPTDPKEIATAVSGGFEVAGAVNTKMLESNLLGAAITKLADTLKLFRFGGTPLESYIKVMSSVEGPDSGGKYCRSFEYLPPFTGTVRACGRNLQEAAQVVRGSPASSSGILPYAKAQEIAMELASRPYYSKVKYRTQADIPASADPMDPESTTYLSNGVTNWAYRAPGKFWLFVVHEIKAGGSGEANRFADHVAVRVNERGDACVVKTVPYSGGNIGDIFRDAFDCPK